MNFKEGREGRMGNFERGKRRERPCDYIIVSDVNVLITVKSWGDGLVKCLSFRR